MRGRRVIMAALAGLLGPLLAGPAAPASGWGWPVEGRSVVRGFDPPAERFGSGHRGVDLAARSGAVVRAAGPGRISYAGLLAGRGVVVVDHGELRTTYEPVDALVRVGESVALGAVLGRVRGPHPGCRASSGSCLHWGLRRGETYVDPLSLVERGPSRLLPVPAPGAERADRAAAVVREVPRVQPASLEREPAWSLRSARTPWAGAALLALLLGLTLLIRRPPWPAPGAPASGMAMPAQEELPETPPSAATSREAEVVDLTEQRARRRA